MEELNAAQQILGMLGVAVMSAPKLAQGNKNASATKKGPGRYHKGGKPGNRINKPRAIRAYAALMAAWAAKRITKAKLRDEHGAYTLVGSTYEVHAAEGETVEPTSREHVFGGVFGNGGHVEYTARRIWLAGISSQRGY